MTVQITSTTDTPEAVLAATGGLARGASKEDTKSASANPADETHGGSEPSENKSSIQEDHDPADIDDDLDDDDQPRSGEDKPNKRNGFKRRIDKLNKRASEAERRAEYWEQEARKQQRTQEPQSKETPKQAPSVDAKPKEDDFSTHAEYVEALTDWKMTQREKEKESRAREESLKNDYQKKTQEFSAKIEELKKSHDDFDDLLANVEDVKVNPGLQEIIVSSDLGAEVAYELAKDRAELERINKLGPLAAAREIGKIEARIVKSSDSKTTTEKKTTSAPAPITPVGSRGTKSTKSPDEMSFSEFKKWREANG